MTIHDAPIETQPTAPAVPIAERPAPLGEPTRPAGRFAVTWWGLLGLIAVAAGIAWRLVGLDGYAMTAGEGRRAFHGWATYVGEGAAGLDGVMTTEPALLLAEAVMFFVGGATDVTARFAPVLFGIGMFGLVLLLRPVARPSVIAGLLFVVALSPSLVYASRTVHPSILLAFFALLTIVAVARASVTSADQRLAGWAGLFGFGVAGLIASGPLGVSAALAMLVAVAFSAITSRSGEQDSPDAIAAGARRLVSSPTALAVAIAAVLASTLVFFTRLFSDVGALGGIWETFQAWGRMVGTSPTTTPAQFFFWSALLYELVAVVLLVVALLVAQHRFGPPSGSAPHLRPGTFGVWFAVAIVLQSLSSGRAPDQFVLVSLPLVLCAGFGLALVLERIEHDRLFTSFDWVTPAAVAGIVVAVIAMGTTVARSREEIPTVTTEELRAQILLITLLAVVPLSYVLQRRMRQPGGGRHVAWSALVVLTVILGLYGARNASMLAFERSDQGTELLAQGTTTDGVQAFVAQTMRLSRDLTMADATAADPTGDATMQDPSGRYSLDIAISPDVEYPYRWYFRDYPEARVATAADWEGADLVIAPTSDGLQEAGFIVQTRTQFNRVPPSYEGMGGGDVLSHIWDPREWYQGIRFLLFRDTVANPPPRAVAFGYSPELSNQINPSLGPFNLTDTPGRGSALGQLDGPVGVGVTDDGEVIYVVDGVNARVQRYGADGTFIGAWSGVESPELAFATAYGLGPTGLAVGDDELIYVADTWNHRVVVLDRSGTFVREIGQPGNAADIADSPDPTLQTGVFFGPRGVAVSEGEVFVTDTGNERVQVFASDGTFLRAFGGFGAEPGQLMEPVGIAVGPDGRVYVADSGNFRVSVFERSGEPVTQLAVPSWQGQANWVNYLTFGPDGLLYVTSPSTGVVEALDPGTGASLWTSTGPQDDPFERPMGITALPSGELLVTDETAHEVIRLMPEIPAEGIIEQPADAASPVASPAASPAPSGTPTDAVVGTPVG